MREQALFDKIDLHLIRVLHTVLTERSVSRTGRQYCERFADRLPVKILDCPIAFPQLMYYQLWHERTHASASAKWLREQVKSVAAALRTQ